VSTLREQALAPLSRSDAERLLPELATGRASLERRLLRARCLKYLESFDLAWSELSAVFPLLKDPLLKARVAVDLMHLSYYLVRRDDFQRYRALAEGPAAGDPLILAELHLGSSIVNTASNEIRQALTDARRAEDVLTGATRGRGRDLVTTRVQRQLAHLLSHSGDYLGARAAADSTVKHAVRLADPAEVAWAGYTVGFVDWFAGRLDGAVEQFTRAEAELRQYGSSLWRHTLLCLARVRLERGELTEGERLARQSATGAAEDHGHIALLRGETEVADLILSRAGTGMPEDEQFRDFVRAIVKAKQGDPRGGVRMLEEAAREFESRGMDHWAIGAAVHAAFWRESIVRGGGTSRAITLVRDIGTRGGEGFAYYLPDVAEWLGRSAERDPQARTLGQKIRARADAAQRRAQADAGEGAGASALDEATFGLRVIGLTWREIGILREMEQLSRDGRRLDREALAKRLSVSPNTLRVHLTRIRAKLDVVDKRGDEVLLEAALSRRPVVI
jgi:DNA-binding CsgD family transcriptional regulator